jgi:hypothetical protein
MALEIDDEEKCSLAHDASPALAVLFEPPSGSFRTTSWVSLTTASMARVSAASSKRPFCVIRCRSCVGGRFMAGHDEAAWNAEFERLGELLVYDNVKQGAIYNDEAKRQAAFRWLAEQARERRARERQTLRVSWWTFWAAIAAVGIAIISVVVALLH